MARKQGARPLEGLGSLPEVSFNGIDWWDLRGADLVNHESGVAEITQVQGFRYRATTRGQIPIEVITYDLGASNPNDYVMRQLRIARDRNKTISWRHTFYGEELLAAAANVGAGSFQVAAAAAGKVKGNLTVLGQAILDAFGSTIVEGDSIIFAGGLDANEERVADATKVKTIEEITLEEDGTFAGTVGKAKVVDSGGVAATANAAAVATVRSTGARLSAGCKVTQVGSFSAGSTGDTPLSSGLQLLPSQAVAQAIAWFGDEP